MKNFIWHSLSDFERLELLAIDIPNYPYGEVIRLPLSDFYRLIALSQLNSAIST